MTAICHSFRMFCYFPPTQEDLALGESDNWALAATTSEASWELPVVKATITLQWIAPSAWSCHRLSSSSEQQSLPGQWWVSQGLETLLSVILPDDLICAALFNMIEFLEWGADQLVILNVMTTQCCEVSVTSKYLQHIHEVHNIRDMKS